MQLNQLNQILALENYKSISETARRLYISQPALSASLNDFENEIGVLLFKRTRTGIEVTEEGRVILNAIRKIVEEVNFIENYAKRPEEYTGEISLVVGYSFEFLYPAIIQIFTDHFSQAILKPLYEVPPNIPTGVNQGLIDFSIATAYTPDGAIIRQFSDNSYKNLTIRKLREIKTFAVMNPIHPLARFSSIKLSDLKNEQLILGRQFYPGNFFPREYFPKYPLQDINRSTVYDLLDSNYGIFMDASPLPQDHFQDLMPKYAITPIDNDLFPDSEDNFSWPAYLIYKSQPPTLLHRAFLENLEQILTHYDLFDE